MNVPMIITVYLSTFVIHLAWCWCTPERQREQDEPGWLDWLLYLYYWPLDTLLTAVWNLAALTLPEEDRSPEQDEDIVDVQDITVHIAEEDLDSVGGTAMALWPETERARIWSPKLRALDLLDAPGLRELDLRGCSGGLHLTVRECESLERILLPDWGPGAVLHLDLSDGTDEWPCLLHTNLPLEIHGKVAELDTCGLFRGLAAPAGRERRGPLDGAWIGVVQQLPPDFDAELLLVVDDDRGWDSGLRDPPPFLLPSGARARELVVQGVWDRELHLDSKALVAVEVGRCDKLRQIRVSDSLQHLRIHRCPKLAQVEGAGESISIARNRSLCPPDPRDISSGKPRADRLQVTGSWSQLHLSDTSLQALYAPQVRRLTVEDCDQLEALEATGCTELKVTGGSQLARLGRGLRVDPGEVAARNLLRCIEQGTPGAMDALFDWVEDQRSPDGVRRALDFLARAATLDVDLDRIWDERCALQRRSLGNPVWLDEAQEMYWRDGQLELPESGRTEGQRAFWLWDFPRDLADRGWAADLGLWLCCREKVQAARDYESVLASSTQAESLAALARGVRKHGEQHPILFDVLQGALLEGIGEARLRASYGEPESPLDALDYCIAPTARLLVRTAVGLRTDPRCPDLVELLAAWLRWRMPFADGVQLLGTLHGMGNRAATRELSALLASPRPIEDGARYLAEAVLNGQPTNTSMAWSGAAPVVVLQGADDAVH